VVAAADLGASCGRIIAARISGDGISLNEVSRFPEQTVFRRRHVVLGHAAPAVRERGTQTPERRHTLADTNRQSVPALDPWSFNL
jgi:hypothetical protein